MGAILKNGYKTVIRIFTSWEFFLFILDKIQKCKNPFCCNLFHLKS